MSIACFGRFEVDRDSGELRSRGLPIRLREQPIRVLLALLDSGGRVVTREELRHRLWPDGVFVEFDRAINKAVCELRRVLDQPGEPSVVETVSKRGYAPLAHWALGRAYLFSRRHQEAVATLERGSELAGQASMWVSELCYARGAAGDRTSADRLVRGLYERCHHEYISPFDLAIACLGVGDRSGALDQLEQAFAQRVMRLTGLGDPEFDRLGTRRQSLLRRLSLPSA